MILQNLPKNVASAVVTFLAVLAACVMPCAAADFYVAPNGNDANPGTIAQPFATLQAARNAARILGTNSTRNIIVRGGSYYNVAVLLQNEMGADDSGLTIQGYPGETAKLYGGMRLTNWTSISNGWYAAALPPLPLLESGVSSLSDWQVRMMLVDGVMAQRAQYPTNTYSLYYTNGYSTTTLNYNTNDLGSWLVPTNAEFQIDYSWDQQTTGASAIDTTAKIVTLSPLLRNDRGLDYTGVNSYRIYNIAQGMSHPGQFFYDRASRTVVYWPVGGKNPNTSECVVPTTTRVFYIKGRQYSRPWGITFSNLTIQVSTADLVNEGNFGYLWDNMSLVQALFCDNLVFDNVNLGSTAGNAIGMEYSFSTNTVLRNSVISNCGGGGAAIRMGPCVISNNLFRSIGLISFQSPAVRVSDGAIVTHNDFVDIKMCAMGDFAMQNCIFSYNHISNAMQVLRDMGAFYSYYGSGTGVHPSGNLIVSNFFENIGLGVQGSGSDPRDWFRNAIYFDEKTSNSVAQGNIVINSKAPFFMNIGTSNAVINNVFINTNGEFLRLYVSPDSFLPNRIERNIFLSSTNILVDNPSKWNSWSGNLFWSTHSPPLTNNVPSGATIADPQFTDVSKLLLTFQTNSPAPALGILPLDLRQAGRMNADLVPPKNLRVIPP